MTNINETSSKELTIEEKIDLLLDIVEWLVDDGVMSAISGKQLLSLEKLKMDRFNRNTILETNSNKK